MRRLTISYAIGIAIGLLVGAYLPQSGGDTAQILERAGGFIVRLGRVALFPLFFASAMLAVDEARSAGLLLRHAARLVGWTIAAVLTSVVTGAAAVSLLRPRRIPPLVQNGVAPELPTVLGELIDSVPANFFSLFVTGPNALAPIVAAAVVLGIALSYDRDASSPVALVADAANRLMYRVNSALTTMCGVLVAIPVASVLAVVRGNDDVRLYGQLLMVVAFTAAVIGLAVYPVVLAVLERSTARPVRWVRSVMTPALAAIATGDVYFAVAVLVRTQHESMRVPRRVGGMVMPVVAIVGRAGTALVGIAAFLVVIRSYTALEIEFREMAGLTLVAFAIAFLLGRYPASGVLVIVAYLAARYGRGMEEAYLVLIPVAILLQRVAAFLDVLTVGFLVEVVARAENGSPRSDGTARHGARRGAR